MRLKISRTLQEDLAKIAKKNKDLIELINKKLKIFLENPQHPSLRIHKLKGKQNDSWSLSINMSIRMLYFINDDVYYFYDIGTHDQVYEK